MQFASRNPLSISLQELMKLKRIKIVLAIISIIGNLLFFIFICLFAKDKISYNK